MANVEAVISWFKARQGKVTYSMKYRTGPNSYDCSSALYYALIAGGFLKEQYPGNTESLYRIEGTLMTPISRDQVRRGDIFVSGVKGASNGGAGHTGIATGPNTIIHCNGTDWGINETPINGRTGSPCYWFRLIGGATSGGNSNSSGILGKVKVKKGANHWSPSSKGTKIASHVIGKTYDYKQKRAINYSKSKWEYLLYSGNTPLGWLLEQDVEGSTTNNPSGGYVKEYNENGTMYATERNWVKRSPTKSAPIVEWQEVNQAIKYHKVIWNDDVVWLQFNYGGGGQAYVAYADAVGTGFGRKYGYCK